MNLVDSSGWIEFFTDSPNAAFFSKPIKNVSKLIVPTISVLEVFKFVLRKAGKQEALSAVAAMSNCKNIIELDFDIALSAATIGVEHKIPMADSIIIATAQKYNATIWTQDDDFSGIEGVRYVEKNK